MLRGLALAAGIMAAAAVAGAAHAASCVLPPDLAADVTDSANDALDTLRVQRELGSPNASQEATATTTNTVQSLVAKAIAHEQVAARAADVIEVARTDKQVGSTPTAAGTTTMAERPTLPALLSLAIERGAILQETDATAVTLSTTPYQFIAMTQGDTPATFAEHDLARRLAVMASLPIDTDQTDGAGGFESEAISALGARFRLFGDRSPRSGRFTELWREKVAELDQKLVDDMESTYTQLFLNAATEETRLLDDATEAMQGVTTLYDNTPAGARPVEAVSELITEALCTKVVLPIQRGEAQVSSEKIEWLRGRLARQATLRTEADNAMKAALDEFSQQGVVTLGYTLFPVDAASDYSEIKAIADGFFAGDAITGFKLVGNALVAFNHESSDAPGDNTLRSFGGAVSLEKGWDLFPGRVQNRINTVLALKLDRLQTVEAQQFGAQLKIEIPILAGFALPIALDYVSRTETEGEDDFKLNVGLNLDTDKLMALARLAGG